MRRKNRNEHLQELVQEYERAFPDWKGHLADVAEWAIRTKRYFPPIADRVSQLQKLIATALRIETFTDPQGRTVRRNHSVRETEATPDGRSVQRVLWKTWDNATDEHMQGSAQKRRLGIYDDCRKLKTDVDSWNENKATRGKEIVTSFDFTPDLEESEYPDTYDGVA